MSDERTSTYPNTVGARAAIVSNLNIFKATKEGGTKKEYEGFGEKIQNHVTISWGFGNYIGHLLKHMEDPKIPETIDMTVAKKAVKCLSSQGFLGPPYASIGDRCNFQNPS